jgi:hypothetical protein
MRSDAQNLQIRRAQHQLVSRGKIGDVGDGRGLRPVIPIRVLDGLASTSGRGDMDYRSARGRACQPAVSSLSLLTRRSQKPPRIGTARALAAVFRDLMNLHADAA